MTRDTQRNHDELDNTNDARVYAALWNAGKAQFPRIPDDAPAELKELTIDLDDPKRVYAIHKGSRRHHFQLLVERYIIQIRYGCTSKTCTTKTCFSCRKRLANGAPVRRYNATSARTLAIYLATQDNPAEGLCHHPAAELPSPSSISKSRRSAEHSPSSRLELPALQKLDDNGPKTITAHTSITRESSSKDLSEQIPHKISGRSSKQRHAKPNLQLLDEPSKKDHRSFVQVVFGTVAFKMVEWLTPRNMQLAAAIEELDLNHLEDDSPAHNTVSDASGLGPSAADISKKGDESTPAIDSIPTYEDGGQSEAMESKDENSSRFDSSHILDPENSVPVLTPTTRPLAMRRTSHVRTTSESVDSSPPKGILNVQSKAPESNADISHFSHTRTHSVQKVVRKALVTSPTISSSESLPMNEEPRQPIEGVSLPEPQTTARQVAEVTAQISEPNPMIRPKSKKPPKKPKTRRPEPDKLPPQSLSYLPVEVIELLCDILQNDKTSETHSLHPQAIDEDSKRHQENCKPLRRILLPANIPNYPQSSKVAWQQFGEQSLFDVLGNPPSLLKSFRDEGNQLFDTQTIWYMMLRMTRVAPALVFDSLWRAAEALFHAPENLEITNDRKTTSSKSGTTAQSISNHDAAQIINVCLHALVASAPLLNDSRKIMNMSRIRSYGLAIIGRGNSLLEPVSLCLQYDDAFSNDPALRLARRLFSAIQTRRRFTEILALQNGTQNAEPQEPDVLDTVLETLNFLDSAIPPALNFSKQERDLHETRVTTLILDWARMVMLQEWQGKAEVSSDGPFGGALTTMAAIYKKRKSLLLGDIHFRTAYFSERLDQVTMPREWLNFESNRRTIHLLDHPYLFNPSSLITYFRSINFSRMNHAHETAKATFGLILTAMGSNRNLIFDKNRRDALNERLSTATAGFFLLEIRRTHVLFDTFNAIWRREERELVRPLKVRLGMNSGEEGLDSGGVQQEFFRLAIAEALNPDYGTFTIDDRTKMTWFQPGSPEPLWKFQLIGTIVSLAVYNGLTLPVTFPKAFYRKLLDEDVTELHHIADGWPDLANGLTTLLEWDEKDGAVEDIFARTYEFSVEQFGQHISREMGNSTHWPHFTDTQSHADNPEDAPLVTNENRNSYVSDYIHWLTDVSIRPQFEAFKTGFFTCIDRRSIKLFDAETLQSIIEGIQEIDISELRRATRYVGWDSTDKAVRDFWSIVRKYDMDQKKKLLEFVTASDRVPVGGMRNMQFTLQKNGVGDGHLPTSYTCYGILLLPEYSSKEVLKDKLAMSLDNAKGFGFA